MDKRIRVEEVGVCSVCGDEVVQGEIVYEFRSGLIHEECLLTYAKSFFQEDKKTMGTE